MPGPFLPLYFVKAEHGTKKDRASQAHWVLYFVYSYGTFFFGSSEAFGPLRKLKYMEMVWAYRSGK